MAFSTGIFILLFCGISFRTNAQANQIIEIQIVDSLSLEPLSGATVSIAKHRHFHISDAQGKVKIDSLPLGEITLHVSYIGYHHQDVKIHLPSTKLLRVFLCSEIGHLHETIIAGAAIGNNFSARARTMMSAEEIQKHQGQNISDLLKNINGLSSMNSAGGIAKPVLRGMHGQRLLILNGNAAMEGQQWGDDHGPEIDPFQANGIEVIKGAASLEYGPAAMGGVIHILPAAYLKQAGIAAKINLQALSNNRQGAFSFKVEGRKGKENFMAWRVQGSMRKAGDAHAPSYQISNTGFNENNQSAMLIFGGKKWTWESNLSRFATVQGIFIGSHLGNIDDLKKALQANRPLIILPFSYNIGKPYQTVEHVLFSTKFNYQIAKNKKLSLLYVQQDNRRQEFDADRIYNQALQGKPATDLEIQSFNAEQSYEQKFRHHWVCKWGASELLQHNTVQGTQFIIPAFQSMSLGAFALLKREWLDANLSLGIRYDKRWLNVPSYFRFQKSYQYQSQMGGPAAGLTYNKQLQKQLSVSISLQSSWRPPAVNELYSYGLHYGVASFEIGSEKLVPERAYLLDINLRKAYQNISIEASAYVQQFNNFIYRSPMPEPILTIRGAFPAFQFMQHNARLMGLEASIVYQRKRAWQWESKFSYLHAQNIDLNQPLIFMPANRMEHTLGYVFSENKLFKLPFIELQSIWVAKQNRYVSGADFTTPPAAYVLLNINTGASFQPFKNGQSWLFNMSIQNVLNQNYRDYMSKFRYFTNDPGINFIFSLQIPISKN